MFFFIYAKKQAPYLLSDVTGVGRISSGEMLDGIIPMNAGEGWL